MLWSYVLARILECSKAMLYQEGWNVLKLCCFKDTGLFWSYVVSRMLECSRPRLIKYTHESWKEMFFTYEVYRCMKIFNEYMWISIWRWNTVYISLYTTYTGTYMTHPSIFFICMQWISGINKVHTYEGSKEMFFTMKYICMKIFSEYMLISI